ncbi:MAG: HAD-IC family P-type ATPase, partial [Anaerovorax sp.]
MTKEIQPEGIQPGESCGCESAKHEHGHEHEAGGSCGCESAKHEHAHEHEAGGSCGCGVEHKDGKIGKTVLLLLISLGALVVSFMNLEVFHYVDPAWIAVIICGFPIFKGAIVALKEERKITSALLISVAILASIALEMVRLSGAMGMVEGHGHGYIFAAGEIAFLMGIGGLIEAWTVRKARSGIEKLVKLVPKTAYLKVDGTVKEVDINTLKIGDTVVIKPGDLIGVDGHVVTGATSVDQSSVTGESLPVDKMVGDEVYSGTQNKNGAIEVQVSKDPKDMTVNKLIALVEEAEGRKAPIARLADQWASYIVPAAMVTAVVVFAVAYFAFDSSVVEAAIRGVTILVVFCPCSLSLATPTAVAAGIGNGSGRGILIKSGAVIEELAKIKTIAFDKTGTLTEGNVQVVGLYAPGEDEDQFMGLMGAAESYTDHPIAKAISRFAENRLRD